MTKDDAALSEAAAEFVEKVRKLDGITIAEAGEQEPDETAMPPNAARVSRLREPGPFMDPNAGSVKATMGLGRRRTLEGDRLCSIGRRM